MYYVFDFAKKHTTKPDKKYKDRDFALVIVGENIESPGGGAFAMPQAVRFFADENGLTMTLCVYVLL